jgi:hypothetical protein
MKLGINELAIQKELDELQLVLDAILDPGTFSIEELGQEQISEEALNQIFSKLHGVSVAITSRFSKLFAPALSKKYKTELSTWMKSEKKTIAAVESMSFTDLEDVVLDLPTGMTSPYLDCATALADILVGTDHMKLCVILRKACDDTLTSISKGSDDHEAVVMSAIGMVNDALKKLKPAVKKADKCFDEKIKVGGGTKLFSELFTSMTDVQKTRTEMLACDEFISQLPVINKINADTVKSVELAVDYVESAYAAQDDTRYIPTKAFISDFTKLLSSVNELFYILGVNSVRAMSLTHNLTFVYKELAKG